MPAKADEPSCSASLLAMGLLVNSVGVPSLTPTDEELIQDVINIPWKADLEFAQRKKVHTSSAFSPVADNQYLQEKKKQNEEEQITAQLKTQVSSPKSLLYQ